MTLLGVVLGVFIALSLAFGCLPECRLCVALSLSKKRARQAAEEHRCVPHQLGPDGPRCRLLQHDCGGTWNACRIRRRMRKAGQLRDRGLTYLDAAQFRYFGQFFIPSQLPLRLRVSYWPINSSPFQKHYFLHILWSGC